MTIRYASSLFHLSNHNSSRHLVWRYSAFLQKILIECIAFSRSWIMIGWRKMANIISGSVAGSQRSVKKETVLRALAVIKGFMVIENFIMIFWKFHLISRANGELVPMKTTRKEVKARVLRWYFRNLRGSPWLPPLLFAAWTKSSSDDMSSWLHRSRSLLEFMSSLLEGK